MTSVIHSFFIGHKIGHLGSQSIVHHVFVGSLSAKLDRSYLQALLFTVVQRFGLEDGGILCGLFPWPRARYCSELDQSQMV